MPPKAEKGQFACFKVKAKKNAGRGSENAAAVVEGLSSQWDDLQELLEEKEDKRTELIEYFNGFIEGEDDLGNILYGDFQTFGDRVKFLDDTIADKYVDEIKRLDIIEMTDD